MATTKFIQSGDLSEKIALYTFDEVGNKVLFSYAYAMVNDKNGLEDLEERGIVSIATVEFTIRYMDNIDTTLEIEHDAMMYNIRHIERIGRRHFLKLTTQIKE